MLLVSLWHGAHMASGMLDANKGGRLEQNLKWELLHWSLNVSKIFDLTA